MSLIVNGVEVDKVIYNGSELDALVYNGVIVFENSDELIMNVSTVNSGLVIDGEGIAVSVSAGNKGCKLTFNNEVKTVAANTQETVVFNLNSPYTGDLVIEGSFNNISIANVGEAGTPEAGYKINEIKKWYKKLSIVPDYFFREQDVSFDINLPTNITKIADNAFFGADNYSGNFTFENLDSCKSFGAQISFFNNATQNGDVWSVDGYVLATYSVSGSSVSERTDTFTIPNGTVKIASALFNFYSDNGSATYYNLSGINLPTDGLLTEIPKRFCADALNLSNITFPSSITQIKEEAFASINQNMTLTEITFNQQKNTLITFSKVGKNSGAFYTKEALSCNIYTDGNLSVLNYDWEGDNRTATFYKLDKTTVITRLATPMISLNGNVLNIDAYDANSAKFSIDAFNQIIETDATSIDLTPYLPASALPSYTITVRSLTGGVYAGSLKASIQFTTATESEG